MQSLDFVTPFVYFFQDKGWIRKFVIASLLTYTLIGATPIVGWLIEIVRRVGRGGQPMVPELAEWKPLWRIGGKFAAVNAVWLLPVLLATIVLYLPLVFAQRMGTTTLLAVFGGTLACVGIFLLVYGVCYAFFFPIMQVLLVRSDSVRQAADPVQLWKTARTHFSETLLVFLVVGLALFNIMLTLAALSAFLLLSPLLVYVGLVGAHFAGQLEGLRD